MGHGLFRLDVQILLLCDLAQLELTHQIRINGPHGIARLGWTARLHGKLCSGCDFGSGNTRSLAG
jgi:hypothetical protein